MSNERGPRCEGCCNKAATMISPIIISPLNTEIGRKTPEGAKSLKILLKIFAIPTRPFREHSGDVPFDGPDDFAVLGQSQGAIKDSVALPVRHRLHLVKNAPDSRRRIF